MSASAPASLIIRDALESDMLACLALDHSYETDTVWQVQVYQEEGKHWQVNFRTERLPRTLTIPNLPDEAQLRAALQAPHGLLVASRRGSDDILGYLALFQHPTLRSGQIAALAVGRPYRRIGIGTRLVNIARGWAKERRIQRLTIETQTKNYPAILFCQAVGFAFCGFNDRYFPNQDIAVFFGQTLR